MIGQLKEKLSSTRAIFKDKIDDLLRSPKNREEIIEELEESLLLADVGLAATDRIVTNIRQSSNKTDSFDGIKARLQEEILHILTQHSGELVFDPAHTVIMFVGVNGGGKTTSLAKLAHYYQARGKNIMMVAADTFRAAAQEQLTLWGDKLNIPVIKGQYGADPAAVTYDALQSFKARGCNLLLVDTAGRIHTNTNLMSELEKIRKIITREIEDAPQEVLLVLDASIGQNALHQAREFLKFSGLTGLFISKLDGTAKGGSVISVVEELKLPIKFIGIGESENDILPFSPEEFTSALLS